MRAFVMAAGYGRRLGGLGEDVPKPLLPLGGAPLIEFALAKLAAAGVREAAVNLHHGAERIRSALGDRARGVDVRYFHEPEILGTAGGLKNAESFLRGGDGPFFVLNADAPCGADLEAALAHHREGGFLSTLILRESPEAREYGELAFDEGGRLRRFLRARAPGAPQGESRPAMFTGLSVMSPAMLDHIPAGAASDISGEIYPRLLESGARVGAVSSGAYWMDAGAPSRYLRANADVLSGAFTPEFLWPPEGFALIEGPPVEWGEGRIDPPVLTVPDASIGRGARAGPFTVLMEGATLGGGAAARECVIFPGGVVGADSILERCIVGPGARAPARGAAIRRTVFLRGGRRPESFAA